MTYRTPEEQRWQQGIECGGFGVWDLDPRLELVHYSPQWKRKLGLGTLDVADSTSFWRCRVHPDDLAPMLHAIRLHLDGTTDTYEMRFRLRSNGCGYRTVLSRGRAVERDHRGDAVRMIGTMVDLSQQPMRQSSGLPKPHALLHGGPPREPFHRLLSLPQARSRGELLDRVSDLLDKAMATPCR
jgi:hypothetical protein